MLEPEEGKFVMTDGVAGRAAAPVSAEAREGGSVLVRWTSQRERVSN